MGLNLQLKPTQHLSLTPQLQQAIRILQLPTLDLLQEIATVLEENPFLEIPETAEAGTATENDSEPTPEVHDAEAWEGHSGSAEADVFDLTAAPSGFRDYLLRQLGCLKVPEQQAAIIAWLIGSLDDEGFLTDPLEVLYHLSPLQKTTLPEWRIALARLQSFDPAGVAAKDLKERLQLQLRNKVGDAPSEILTVAMQVAEEGLELLSRKKYTELRQKLGCTVASLKAAISLIEGLDPHPVSAWEDVTFQYLVPELEVRKIRGHWKVLPIQRLFPQLQLNEIYASSIRAVKDERDHALWMGKLSEARAFLKNIRQREQTILQVAEQIVKEQEAFFNEGVAALKPLVLRDIAEKLSIHESTVSRVTNGKYLQCPRGIFELKFFFTSKSSAQQDGPELSAAAVQQKIKALIESENPKKPLSDQSLCDALKESGIPVARRTVAKYREQLAIPAASLRKRL